MQEFDLEPADIEARIFIDDLLIEKARWHRVIPKAGHQVMIRVEREIFSGVCAVLLKPPSEPDGRGGIGEITLIDYPGCPNARILKFWEG